MIEINKIYKEDCLELMKKIDDCSVDLVLTDPPYGTNYGKIKNDEDTTVFKQSIQPIFRILKNNSFFITYCYPLFIPEIIEHAKKQGFTYRWIGFNYYPNMFKQKPQPLGYNRYDSFIIFSKGNAKKQAYMKDVVHILMDKVKPIHPHQKPMKAIEKLIKCASKENDLVFDPFMGSGTTIVSADRQGRKWIGCDIEKSYCEMAKQWLDSDRIIRG